MPLPNPPIHPIVVPFTYRAAHYRAILDPKRDPPLWVEDDKGHRFVSTTHKRWRPWKLQVGDVDGDGYPDLLVGVTKATHQFHFPHTCLFVYTFNGKQIRKKWLGSTMGRPLLDYTLAKPDQDGWQQVFTLEQTLKGKAALTRYRWRVFGFHQNSHQQSWDRAYHLESVHGIIRLIADGKQVLIDPKTWN